MLSFLLASTRLAFIMGFARRIKLLISHTREIDLLRRKPSYTPTESVYMSLTSCSEPNLNQDSVACMAVERSVHRRFQSPRPYANGPVQRHYRHRLFPRSLSRSDHVGHSSSEYRRPRKSSNKDIETVITASDARSSDS